MTPPTFAPSFGSAATVGVISHGLLAAAGESVAPVSSCTEAPLEESFWPLAATDPGAVDANSHSAKRKRVCEAARYAAGTINSIETLIQGDGRLPDCAELGPSTKS